MKTVHMIEDFRKILASDKRRFEAFREYTQKYSAFFGGVFKYLYHCPIEAIEPMIEKADLETGLHNAEENYKNGICDMVISSARKTAELLGADMDFELLLGLEMRNIGGCSIPCADGVSRLYMGIDRPLTAESISILVPHEMFHMLHAAGAGINENETLLDRAVEEGIATFIPMWISGMDESLPNMAAVLFTDEGSAEKLIAGRDSILQEILDRRDEPLTAEHMRDFFTALGSSLGIKGYYAGLYLTMNAVKNGFDMTRCIGTPTKELARIFTSYLK